tara:strand:- start:2000 stop:2920 length:921 start_codon:yes stop_codon:yes gene_type:complete
MVLSVKHALTTAQTLIYSKKNIARAYEGFDDTDITGIYKIENDRIQIVRDTGDEEVLSASKIRSAFQSHIGRLPDYFSYLSPEYSGPTYWKYNACILFKGWKFDKSQYPAAIKLQNLVSKRCNRIDDIEILKSFIQSDQNQLGYLVAPEGLVFPSKSSELLNDLNDINLKKEKVHRTPYCSCPSFQRQLNNLSSFQDEIKDYKPTCKHITWIHKFRELCGARTKLRNVAPGNSPALCVAWGYKLPDKLSLLWTRSGAQAPMSCWAEYKPDEHFTRKDAWSLFDRMIDKGFLPVLGSSLPQLSHYFK